MTNRTPRDRTGPKRPALLTGTSSEFLGRRPLPCILRERHAVLVFGPPGSGKSTVARRLAAIAPDGRSMPGAVITELDANQLQEALVWRVARRQWAAPLVDAPALVLDGPMFLRSRPAAVDALAELLRARSGFGRRTLVVQNGDDLSLDALMAKMEPGAIGVVGLRFPKGPRGRQRFARRVCDELSLPRSEAKRADSLDPWGYAAVIELLRSRTRRTGP